MDEGILGQYKLFFLNAAGKDLIERIRVTEAKYMMEGMKATGMEDKALSMARMEATYAIRTMLEDLAKPKVASKGSVSSTPSN